MAKRTAKTGTKEDKKPAKKYAGPKTLYVLPRGYDEYRDEVPGFMTPEAFAEDQCLATGEECDVAVFEFVGLKTLVNQGLRLRLAPVSRTGTRGQGE